MADNGGTQLGAESRSNGFAWRRLWPLGLVAVILAAGYALGLHRFLSLDTIIREHATLKNWVSENVWTAALSYVAVYIAAVAVSFPGASLLTLVGGLMFGLIAGTALTVLGATAGASIIFLIAKTSLGASLRKRANRFVDRLARGFEESAFLYLLSLRLQPIFPFWLINVAPAMFNVSLGTYVAATAIGIIPGTAAYVLLGDGLGAVIAAQEAANPGCAAAGNCAVDLGALVSPVMIAALVALSLVALAPALVRRWRRNGRNQTS
ncbi:TVP38/TMEM64 family protein [Acuticoccus sp. MNP-M23]|uniref:TVP38/TMEM64 family protein n=1 Tax=Acuticoccus sp. MNP-M23 TaxID=3072793 RepID=UPI002814E469|nr:TVP38/TMEM64 family protein [Acuticoccus sp. MNP-M23]WMS42724.1 TVP38/TMEM64 family protein [Acuticoccus sp. MNP-M23]